MAKRVKKFNPKAKCLQCGSGDINTHYCNIPELKFSSDCEFLKKMNFDDLPDEHLHRFCQCCKYSWPETCIELDQLAEEQK